jgi:predicted membrane protein
VDLDLSRYNLQRLSVKNTAGAVAVRLGAAEGTIPVDISVSLGDLTLYVPREVGLRVTGGVSLGDNEFEGAGLRRSGSSWEDEAFGSASRKVEADLRVSVGKITVRRF